MNMQFQTIVNPLDAIDFKRTTAELQAFLMFAIVVAGKTAKVQSRKLREFFEGNTYGLLPFMYLHQLRREDRLREELERVKMGKYNLIEKAFRYLAKYGHMMHLDTLSVEHLMEIPGVGLKTAKFFVMFSRNTETHAVLDTHILKWMQSVGINVPSKTPTSEKLYSALECRYIETIRGSYFLHDDSLPERLVRADFAIWKHYANGEPLPVDLEPWVVDNKGSIKCAATFNAPLEPSCPYSVHEC